ncbi:MAG: hypothetical protein KC438_09380 [Thermomicrobiales bacterium]|nr:hypothetical protein [Thermomicrobiales bacterium]MCO5220877.1 hypothetical protein [Thermomicrobiales bacterium]
MKRGSLRRFSFVAAIAFAMLALAALPATRTLAQDDVIVPINELNDSGVAGDASLTDNGDGTTTIDILVDGATGGHPAQIVAGSCEMPGEAAYALTEVDASGGSVTVLDVSLADLTATGPFAILIQLSADDTGTAVACGDLPQAAVGGGETAATEEQPAAEPTPDAVGGTSSVTDIGTSGVGTTFTSNSGMLVLALGALGMMLLVGAFGIRRGSQRS